MKSFENSFETPKVCLSCSIWLENHFFPTGNKKIEKKDFVLFSFEKCRIVPKNEKGGTLEFINIHSVAKYQKTRRGDSFETLKNFEKKSHSAEKNWKGGPFGLFRFCRLRKKVKNERGDPLH